LRIVLAKTAGFCMGVKRAMDKVLALARNRDGRVFTVGPLIHNRQVVEMLEARGIRAATVFEDIDRGTVLLRTHGVPPDVVEQLRAAGLEVEDGTCPHVLRGQRSIARRSAEGYRVIIVGDRDHDEVAGLAGHAAGPCHIIASVAEAREVPLEGPTLVVAQTTFEQNLFDRICAELRRRKPDVEVVESICTATSERQAEARELAERVDAMVVVGGYHSANTRRLAEVARATGTPTYHVETADELDGSTLAGYGVVGVTAGASTPSWITSTVIERLRRIGESRTPVARAARWLGEMVLDGNVYVAAGAAAVCYAAMKMLNLTWSRWARAGLMVAAFGYIFSAYSLGRMAGSGAADSGLTRRGAFFQAHRQALGAASVVMAVISVAAVVPFGWVAVVLLGVSYATALAYGALMSPRRGRGLGFVRNVPASKDLFAAAGWTAVTVLVPVVAAVEETPVSVYAVAAVAAFVFGLAFIRSVMFDFSDVMADRLLGRDTLPSVVGIVRARLVLAVLALGLAGLVAAATALGWLAGPGYWMMLCPAYVLGYVLVFGEGVTASEHRCAVVVDGGMWLVGLIALGHALLM
jgi:4-hydroxy-3-methylbut-2-enyl diphosphate reductase